jgi:hypothetical protein
LFLNYSKSLSSVMNMSLCYTASPLLFIEAIACFIWLILLRRSSF